MAYEESDIRSKCIEAMKDPKNFYKKDFVNYRGKFPNTGVYFNEAVAEFVIAHFDELVGGIPQITRQTTYKTAGHDGKYDPASNRVEEQIAMDMFRQGDFDFIGKVIDYQTPLKNVKDDDIGKIDMLSYNKADGTLRILELKKPDSKETMLRCALEAFTYLRTVDRDKLIADFGLPADTVVKACPLVFLDGVQHEEWLDEKRPNLHKFMSVNDIQPFFVERTGSGYKVYSAYILIT